ncbi:MAG: ubiquinone/menaquinone biosynthesis methyltransferase [Candidatus Eremiobacteraeota bacterium]|nr:ubiquinone/menaquinone biosynthesis methyltransferase [Candidatus Eremiobacteraeota bacterium]
MLKTLFEAIRPADYDLMNRVMTLGLDEGWRCKAARSLLAREPRQVLDLCCGTGDLACALARESLRNKSACTITGLDFCGPFLDHGRKKSRCEGLAVSWVKGDSAFLPFQDSSFDGIGITFAFRNLTHHNPQSAAFLAEMLRVLRKEGSLVFFETAQPPHPAVKWLFRTYLRRVIPLLGGIITRNRKAYSYLAGSTSEFMDSRQVTELLRDAGFNEIKAEPFFFGAVCLYSCRKP